MGIHGPSDYLRPNYVTQNSAGDDLLVTNSKPGFREIQDTAKLILCKSSLRAK